jgi:hypothetical protein
MSDAVRVCAAAETANPKIVAANAQGSCALIFVTPAASRSSTRFGMDAMLERDFCGEAAGCVTENAGSDRAPET